MHAARRLAEGTLQLFRGSARIWRLPVTSPTCSIHPPIPFATAPPEGGAGRVSGRVCCPVFNLTLRELFYYIVLQDVAIIWVDRHGARALQISTPIRAGPANSRGPVPFGGQVPPEVGGKCYCRMRTSGSGPAQGAGLPAGWFPNPPNPATPPRIPLNFRFPA